ncbi:MAG: FtsX-like permease family protein, partial [Spirochaetales bacterium]|nr:FtsX-like permease family protein [Spirochaetales bacterium]
PYYLEYAIAGVYRSDSAEFDEGAFLIGIADAQELVYVGEDVREVRVILEDPAQADAVAARFRSTYAADSEIRIQTWRERNRGLVVLIELMDVFIYAINLLIVIVAATVITNAILMNTFEKAREQGMMRAIGLTRRGQFRLIMAEGVTYGVVGSLAGLAIGIPLVLYFQTHGIDFGEVSESFGLGRELTFRFRPIAAVVNATFGTLVALAGSLYAAFVATRSTILASLRGSN